MPRIDRPLVVGVLLCVAAGLAAWESATLSWNGKLQLSALTLAIVAGIALGNTVPQSALARVHPGLKFSQQKLLRLGIILYGLRLTLGDIVKLGPRALLLDATVITTVLLGGYWLGTRILGMDRDTALLVSAGSGICGAAAVLATDRVIETESHKVSVAVATVVVFGTVAMFLYPVLYPLTGFSERHFGIYTGATVHEVAQALAAGRAVSQTASDTAVLTKMLRVLLLAPVLLIVGRVRARGASRKIAFPWFVVGFGAVIVVQSLIAIPGSARSALINVDTVLLSAAMFALGLATRAQQLKQAGTKPLLLALIIFLALVTGGYALVRAFV
ncbi:MAG TPA: YeiH family protein [Candidatus Limnocylindrales bacterium]|nr:YeiH family protein [Candidatus Limnocylindrales bacterium]